MIDMCPKCGRVHDLNPLRGSCDAALRSTPQAMFSRFKLIKSRFLQHTLLDEQDSFVPIWAAEAEFSVQKALRDIADDVIECKAWNGFRRGSAELETIILVQNMSIREIPDRWRERARWLIIDYSKPYVELLRSVHVFFADEVASF